MFLDAHTHNPKADALSVVQFSPELWPEQAFSAGIHPWLTGDQKNDFKVIEVLATSPNCVAIGETGLDRSVNNDFNRQRVVFEAHILLSEALGLPLILHCVKAWPAVLEVRKRLKPQQPWIFHGFSKRGLLEEVVNENMMISFGKALLNNTLIKDVAQKIPLTKVLLETDDSGLPIMSIYKQMAAIRQMELSVLEKEIAVNFTNTFKKWQIG